MNFKQTFIMKIRWVLLAMLMAVLSITANARQVTLSNLPIEVNLQTGAELIITFPDTVTHTNILTAENTDKLTTFLTPEGVLYLTANENFGTTRLVAELVDGKLVVLDLKASSAYATDKQLTIVKPTAATIPPLPAPVPATNPHKPDFLSDNAAKTKSQQPSTANGHQAPGFHSMVQFGFRHFVGPSRLIGEEVKGKKLTVGTVDSKRLLRVIGGQVHIKPLAQWKIEDKYLTVLLVNNHSARPVEFDPRAIRGRWQFAAALYPVIAPRGSRYDQTLWALISAEPFAKAIH